MSRSQDPRDPHEPLPTVERTGPCAADPDAVPALARPLDRLRAVQATTLAPLVRWSASDAGAVLVHEVPAGAVPLDSLRREGPLRAGHVLAVALAVTDALVALHDAGLAHGSVDPMSVLVAPDGSVLLAGTGLGWRAAPGMLGGPTPEADVAAVGDLMRLLIGRGGAPGALVLAALRASDSDPLLRPEAAGLAGLLRASGRPESLLDALWHQPGAALPPAVPDAVSARRPASGAPPRPGAPRTTGATVAGAEVARAASATPGARARARREATSARRRPSVSLRTIATVALVAVVGMGAVRAVTAVGARAAEEGPTTMRPTTAETASASAGPPSTDAAAPTTTSPSTAAAPALDPGAGGDQQVDWAGVLAALDSGRRTALAAGSRDDLARWVDPAGAAWGRDAALLQRMAGSDARIDGGELVLEEVRPLRAEADRVLLAVRDRRTAYDVVQDGTATHVPERAAAWWTVTLTPLPALEGEGWRIAEVRGREDRAG